MKLGIWITFIGLALGSGSLVHASASQPNLHVGNMPARSLGWFQTSVPKRIAAEPIDPSLPQPITSSTQPPVEWPLVALQSFSGVIAVGLGSLLVQSIFDEKVVNAPGIVSHLVMLGTAPWIASGLVFGLGQLSNNYRSSFWWTLLGAFIGQSISFGIGILVEELTTIKSEATGQWVRIVLDGILAGFGAVLFYTLLRYPVGNVQQIGSLLQYHNGTWTWGVPIPTISQQYDNTIVSVPVIKGRF